MSYPAKPASASPTKKSTKTVVTTTTTQRFSDYMLDQRNYADLQIALKQSQDSEENLKNLLMGLNVKMTAYVDQKQDLKQT